jgi:hypothetical protein
MNSQHYKANPKNGELLPKLLKKADKTLLSALLRISVSLGYGLLLAHAYWRTRCGAPQLILP